MRTVLLKHADYCCPGGHIPRSLRREKRSTLLEEQTLFVGPNSPLKIPTYDYDPVCPVYAHHYAPDPMLAHELYAQMIMFPIVTKPAVAPALTKGNEIFCVNERIKRIRNTTKLSGSFDCRVKQFAQLIQDFIFSKTGKRSVAPYDLNLTLERMPRHDKAAKITTFGTLASKLIHSFQKKEAYPEMKAPRNISNCDEKHMHELSSFTYAVDDLIHAADLPWYMPGRKPVQIGRAVGRVTLLPFVGADISRFDGRQNRALRRVAIQVLKKLIDPYYHKEFLALCHKELNMQGVTSQGVFYDLEGTMASGSPLTTLGNTLLNAFFYFLSFLKSGDKNYAWKRLCKEVIVYGDDSIGPEEGWEDYKQLMNKHGLVVTQEDSTDGASFLGRIYPVRGQPHSIMDLRRQFPKMHIACASGPIEAVACNKAIGLRSINPQEWWISKICKYIERKHGNLQWDSRYATAEDFFKKKRLGPFADWPDGFEDIAIDLCAKWCGCSRLAFLEHIEQYDSDELIIAPWVNNGQHETVGMWCFDPFCTDYHQCQLSAPTVEPLTTCWCFNRHDEVSW